MNNGFGVLSKITNREELSEYESFYQQAFEVWLSDRQRKVLAHRAIEVLARNRRRFPRPKSPGYWNRPKLSVLIVARQSSNDFIKHGQRVAQHFFEFVFRLPLSDRPIDGAGGKPLHPSRRLLALVFALPLWRIQIFDVLLDLKLRFGFKLTPGCLCPLRMEALRLVERHRKDARREPKEGQKLAVS